MPFPAKRDLTVDWFNSVFNPKGIQVHEFAFAGKTEQGNMGTLERVELKVSKLFDDATTTSSGSTSVGTETLVVLLKTLPKDPFRKLYASNDEFSSREVSMYTEVFKEWDKFMDDRKIPLTSRFKHPNCYFGAEAEDGTNYKYLLVLENLTAPHSKFVLWKTGFTEPLQWTAAAAVIRQIARFHATGIAYKAEMHIESYYKLFPKLKHVVNPMFKKMCDEGFAVAKDVIGTVVDAKDIPEGLYARLDELHSDASRNLVTKWFTDPTMIAAFGNTATICHHDLHSQNLVLSNDHSDAVLFDYQACCVFNPMKDLSFFLLLNCETEDITLNLPRALQFYCDEFQRTMAAMNVDFEYSLESIRRDYDENFAFSLVHVMTGAPIWICGPKSSRTSKRRFAFAVINAYRQGILRFPDALF